MRDLKAVVRAAQRLRAARKPKFSRDAVRGLRDGAAKARRSLQIWGCDDDVRADAREYERRAQRTVAKGPLSRHGEYEVAFARAFSAIVGKKCQR